MLSDEALRQVCRVVENLANTPDEYASARARLLNAASRLSFFENTERLEVEYRRQLSTLAWGLQQLTNELSGRFVLEVDTKTTFAAFVRDRSRGTTVAGCHIDSTTTGILALHFTVGEYHEARCLQLELFAPFVGIELSMLGEYCWHDGSRIVASDALPRHIVKTLFDFAVQSILECTPSPAAGTDAAGTRAPTATAP